MAAKKSAAKSKTTKKKFPAKKPASVKKAATPQPTEQTRRDFIVLTASATAGVGAASAIWPFVDSLNPAADVLAMASTEVDLSPIEPGQGVTVMWRGKPVFIRHRTAEEIEEAKAVSLNDLPDPETDEARTHKGEEQWLVIVGVCTHLGCVPLGQQGDFGGT
jgi:ubiquinol-cytochrome c reductase iron-sulfur subunit